MPAPGPSASPAATGSPVPHFDQVPSVLMNFLYSQEHCCYRYLDCKLDLKTIALHARNAEYNPKARFSPIRHRDDRVCSSFPLSQRFAAVIMRIRDPKTTALIFASGKMVVTGAKSEDDSRLASRKYARIVQNLASTRSSWILKSRTLLEVAMSSSR